MRHIMPTHWMPTQDGPDEAAASEDEKRSEQFFTDEQLRERWKGGRTTLYRMRQEGRLPPPVKISGNSKGTEPDACDGGRGVGERKAMTNILAIGLTFFLFLCGLAIGAVVGVYRAEHTAKISSAAKEFPRAYGIELKGEKE